MKQWVWLPVSVMALIGPLHAKQRLQGDCTQGGNAVVTNGVSSVTKVMRSFPLCTVTVYQTGTLTLASLFSDNSGTVQANPFTATNNGHWFFYAANGRYDVRLSGAGIPTPFTLGDLMLSDPADNVIINPTVNLADPTQATGVLPTSHGGSGTSILFTPGSVIFAGIGGVYTQDNGSFFYDAVKHGLAIGKGSLPQGQFWLGSGNLEGYGMAGTGLDTPTLLALSQGTAASPNGSSFPTATFGRINNGTYTSGLGNWVFYGEKVGPPGGSPAGAAMENVTVSTRQLSNPSDLVGLYSRTVMSQGTAYTSGTFGVGWAHAASCQKLTAFDKCSVVEWDVDNQSGVDPAGPEYSSSGLMNGTAIVGFGKAHNSQAIAVDSLITTGALLQGAINASVTTFTVGVPTAGAFASPCVVEIDNEIIACSSYNAGTRTLSGCTRNSSNTVAASHADGSAVNESASFLRGIDFSNASLAPGAYMMLVPNRHAIGGRDNAGTTFTPWIWEDSAGNEAINYGTGKFLNIWMNASPVSVGTLVASFDNGGNFQMAGTGKIGNGSVPFISLGAPIDGSQIYCTDCNSTCTAAGGPGRTCFREHGTWTH